MSWAVCSLGAVGNNAVDSVHPGLLRLCDTQHLPSCADAPTHTSKDPRAIPRSLSAKGQLMAAIHCRRLWDVQAKVAEVRKCAAPHNMLLSTSSGQNLQGCCKIPSIRVTRICRTVRDTVQGTDGIKFNSLFHGHSCMHGNFTDSCIRTAGAVMAMEHWRALSAHVFVDQTA